MVGKERPKHAISKTLESYGSNSTVHGISYVLSGESPTSDRLFWLFLVLTSIFLAAFFSWKSYDNWMENPVITSLEETSRSVKTIKYPAITICSEGLNMLAVEKILQRELNTWRTKKKRQKRGASIADHDLLQEEKAEFLLEKFEISSKNHKIYNIIKSFLVTTDVDNFMRADGVRENLVACDKQAGGQEVKNFKRRKRSNGACDGETLTGPLYCSKSEFHQYHNCDCGSYGKVSKFFSTNNDNYEDRSWEISCQNIPNFIEEKSGVTQSVRHQNWEITPNQQNAFIKGLESWYGDKDRTYQVRWSMNSSFVVGECTDWQQIGGYLWTNIEFGPLAGDEVFGALKSNYLGNYYNDREFHVKVCKISSKGRISTGFPKRVILEINFFS